MNHDLVALFIVLFILIVFGISIWIYMTFIWKPTPSRMMPHKYDNMSPIEALHAMEMRITILEEDQKKMRSNEHKVEQVRTETISNTDT